MVTSIGALPFLRTLLSLVAKRIENESWKTTESLVEAFAEEKNDICLTPISPVICEAAALSCEEKNEDQSDLRKSLGSLIDFVDAIRSENLSLQREIAVNMGKLPDAIVDEINEIAAEAYGDILVEDRDGQLSVIEDYIEYLE